VAVVGPTTACVIVSVVRAVGSRQPPTQLDSSPQNLLLPRCPFPRSLPRRPAALACCTCCWWPCWRSSSATLQMWRCRC
jgi:hypothetical protein